MPANAPRRSTDGSEIIAPQVRPRASADPRLGVYIVVALIAMVAVPAGITLHTVHTPASFQVSDPNPTPHGYTVSLLLFIVPIFVIAAWFLPSEGLDIPRRAFWRTTAVLVLFGCGLDYFFANRFFLFTNSGATLGIRAPALQGGVPIEEYLFYLTGFIAILLMYVWSNEFWFAAYQRPDYTFEAKKLDRLFHFHPTSVVVAALLITAGVLYKKLISPSPAGFPGYFTFLVGLGLAPAAGFFPVVRSFINWRAFSLTLFFILLVSLFWEATLAVPYGWWGYQKQQMLGLAIGAWNDLPVEAVLVWVAVTYATAVVFETVKLWLASGRTARESFLGLR